MEMEGLGFGWAKAETQELNLSIMCGWQRPDLLEHHLLHLNVFISRLLESEDKADTETIYSAGECRCLNC